MSTIAALAIATPVAAQVISLKTVPIPAGNQFLFQPSRTLAMGGVGLALDDVLYDPFTNPARGALIERSTAFLAPTSYTISFESGAARTLPAGVLATGERWFGGGIAAVQTIESGAETRPWWQPWRTVNNPDVLPDIGFLNNRSASNKYVQGFVGRRLTERTSIGASIALADLNALDGVEHMFANAWEIEEWGHSEDFRVGVTTELADGGRLDASFVHNRFSMVHDVTAVDFVLADSLLWLFDADVTNERHKNKTSTWGLRVGLQRPIEGSAWSYGFSGTANRKLHPKIPAYELEVVTPIPRDPGDSWAFSLGAGMAYENETTRFAVDITYDPAQSDTWADALTDVVAADSSVIPAGAKTVENQFAFQNASFSTGVDTDLDEVVSMQFGVHARLYDYRLEQQNHVTQIDRGMNQQWTEWTPTWGLTVSWNDMELQYVGLASSASHFPFLSFNFGEGDVLNPGAIQDTDLAGPDLLAPPDRRFEPSDHTTVTHRLMVAIPIG